MSNYPTDKAEPSEYPPRWARSLRNQNNPVVNGADSPSWSDLSEQDRARLLRSLKPELVRAPELDPWRPKRIPSLSSLIMAVAIGVAVAVFVTGAFPSRWNPALWFSGTDRMTSRSRDNAPNTEEQGNSNTGGLPVTTTLPQPTNEPTARLPEQVNSLAGIAPTAPTPQPSSGVPLQMNSPAPGLSIAGTGTQVPAHVASVGNGNQPVPNVRGVTDKEIQFGISAPFSGAAKDLGNQMKLGIDTAFNLVNDAGGINGRQVKLAVADDGYEPTRTADTMKQLYEKQQVFGFIGNVGTPTAVVALPYALQHHALFFGAFTGADLLRRDPPDRYVFNYRASYAEETDAVVRYLVKVRHVRTDQIAVFAQHDAFGDAGFAGVARAMRALGGNDEAILRLDYERNTVDVDAAVAGLRAHMDAAVTDGRAPKNVAHKAPIKAVVMVAAYRAAAKFIERTRDLYPTMIYTNVSFVGSTSLAAELMLLGPRFANGVIVTQVVPAVDSYASAILKYKTALAKYFPGEAPDYVSLEGYVDGSLLLEGLKRAGPQPDTDKLVDGLESLHNFDMGLGTPISFSQSEHQGSHKVWGTQLDDHGHYQPIDLE